MTLEESYETIGEDLDGEPISREGCQCEHGGYCKPCDDELARQPESAEKGEEE